MSARGLLAATVVLALLTAGVWYSNRQEEQKTGERPPDAPRLATLPLADISRIHVEQPAEPGAQPYTIERVANGDYRITAPAAIAADPDAASGLFLQFSALDADRIVDEKPTDLKAFGLDPAHYSFTVTKQKGGDLTLLLGDDSPTGATVYAKLGTEARVVLLPKSIASSMQKPLAEIRDKHLAPLDRSTLKTLTITAKAARSVFTTAPTGWLVNGSRAASSAVEALTNALGDARMNPAATGAELDANAKAWPSAALAGTVEVASNTGRHTLEVRRNGDKVYLKSSVMDGIHTGDAMLADALAKPAAEYRNKSLFDFGFDQLTRIDLKGDGLTRTLTYTGSNWTENGKPLDIVGAQSLVDKLRELEANGFTARAAGTPTLTITAVSGEGKRTEQVTFNRAGNSYHATRQGEPDTYVLDAKAVDELRQAAGDVRAAEPASQKK